MLKEILEDTLRRCDELESQRDEANKLRRGAEASLEVARRLAEEWRERCIEYTYGEGEYIYGPVSENLLPWEEIDKPLTKEKSNGME